MSTSIQEPAQQGNVCLPRQVYLLSPLLLSLRGILREDQFSQMMRHLSFGLSWDLNNALLLMMVYWR